MSDQTDPKFSADLQDQLSRMQQTTALHPHDWRVLEQKIAADLLVWRERGETLEREKAEIEELKPDAHRHMTLLASYGMLAGLFNDIGESHSILSRRGNVLGDRLPARVTLLCERAETAERERDEAIAARDETRVFFGDASPKSEALRQQFYREREADKASLATLRTEQGRLRDALVSYGMHTADCLNAEAPCSCGFVEALAGDYERTATEPQSVDDVLDIYVPGRWRCLKCAFVLSRATIFMASGEIGSSRDDVMRMTGEVCPNDGELMVRVTWREDAAESREFSERLITDVMEATGAEHLPAALDRMRQAKAALLARGSRGDETAKGGSDE